MSIKLHKYGTCGRPLGTKTYDSMDKALEALKNYKAFRAFNRPDGTRSVWFRSEKNHFEYCMVIG